MSVLSQSLEDYLEAIYKIEEAKGASRVTDIAKRLGVTSPSVTAALRALSDRGYVNYTPYDIITLTDAGVSRARGVALRHAALETFLTRALFIAPQDATETACRLEHGLPAEALERFQAFVSHLETAPPPVRAWLAEFERQCRSRAARTPDLFDPAEPEEAQEDGYHG